MFKVIYWVIYAKQIPNNQVSQPIWDHEASLDVSTVQLGRHLNAERQERSKAGTNARGRAGGDITLAWLREASPSQRRHDYPAGFVWRWAQMQRMMSPMSSGCLTAGDAHLFKLKLTFVPVIVSQFGL